MNKIENKIRILNVTELPLLDSLHLSKVEYKIFWFIKTVISTESQAVAETLNLTISYASSLLRTLYNKGYLDRKEVPDKTGGYYFEYRINKKLRLVFRHIPL